MFVSCRQDEPTGLPPPTPTPPCECMDFPASVHESDGICIFTTSLWSLLVKSKAGRMDLNLLRISLCLVMSVARMHLQVTEVGRNPDYKVSLSHTAHAKKFRGTLSLDDSFPDAFVLICRQISEDVVLWLQNTKHIYCYFTTGGAPDYSASRAPGASKRTRVSHQRRLQCLCVVYLICSFPPASPSLVSQRPQHSGGSPVGRCRCIGAPVQSER